MTLICYDQGAGGSFIGSLLPNSQYVYMEEKNEYGLQAWRPYNKHTTIDGKDFLIGSENSEVFISHTHPSFNFISSTNIKDLINELKDKYNKEIDHIIYIEPDEDLMLYFKLLFNIKRKILQKDDIISLFNEHHYYKPIDFADTNTKISRINYNDCIIQGDSSGTFLDDFKQEIEEYNNKNFHMLYKVFEEKNIKIGLQYLEMIKGI